jgi:hypothetical protein
MLYMRKCFQRALARSSRLQRIARWSARKADIGITRLIQLVRSGNFEPVDINPQYVLYTVSRYDRTLKGNKKWHFGSLKDGDWDKNGYAIENYGSIMSILKKRVENKSAFDNIEEYLQNLVYIEAGGTPDNCYTCRQYEAKWRSIEMLYYQIKANGYRTQTELGTNQPYNELRIQIGREGELLFEDGIHRLIIAKLLGMDKVPAIITRRHKQYARDNGNLLNNNSVQK